MQRTLEQLTREYGGRLRAALGVDDVVLVSVDARGIDARVRRGTEFGIERLGFHPAAAATDGEAAAGALGALLRRMEADGESKPA